MRKAGLVAFTVALVVLASGASAGKGKKKDGDKSGVEPDASYETAPSYRYGQLAADACRSELGAREIEFTVVDEAPGVLAPVRIPNGVGGVRFHTALPEKQQRTSPWEVFDCRLVLALHDMSSILREHLIDDVVIFSAWRPNKKQPKGKLAIRHPGALAVDVYKLGKLVQDESGEPKRVWLEVEKDFHGQIGATTCGQGAAAPTKDTAEAKELRAIICGAADRRLFTSILTPNYNKAHFNHFHLEVTPDVKWRLIR